MKTNTFMLNILLHVVKKLRLMNKKIGASELF